jgi:hypothetical protein
MGGGSYSSTHYDSAVKGLHDSGKAFTRSATARSTGDYVTSIADILDPRKLKNGMRESCFAPGASTLMSILIGIDGTGSMSRVPHALQAELSKLITMLVEQGITDHPNVAFMLFDDEDVVQHAAFQMSQFEIEADPLLASLNEMVIPSNGGGNDSESYHLTFYAAANHTRLEGFERDGTKGFLFIIGDENPYVGNKWATRGTSPAIAKELFGDSLQGEVTMLESVKKAAERYHVFLIRPGAASNFSNKRISEEWRKLFIEAGINGQHVLEVQDTDTIVTTIAMTIGKVSGMEDEEMVDVLTAKGAKGVASAASAVKDLVPIAGGAVAVASTNTEVATGKTEGRER